MNEISIINKTTNTSMNTSNLELIKKLQVVQSATKGSG